MKNYTLKGSAKENKTGGIVLTTNFHQNGTLNLNKKINISTKPWTINFSFKISKNKGASDEDGSGGDGLWLEFDKRKFAIGFDTFKNDLNKTGNEIHLYLENEIVSQKHCSIKMNSGKLIKAKIICEPNKFIKILINDSLILNHSFKQINLSSLFDSEECSFRVFSFTGAAASTQEIKKLNVLF